MSIRILLVGCLCIAALSAASEAKPSVTWSYTFTGRDAGASPSLDDVLASARAARRPVMIDFTAEWCAACRLLDRDTYTAPDVIREADRFVTIRIDATNVDDVTQRFTQRFGVRGLPTLVFVTSRGAVLASSKILGLVDGPRLARAMRGVP